MNTNRHELGENRILFKDEVYEIINCALDVSNILGNGFLEAVYQEALEIEFNKRNLPFQSQKKLEIKYKDKILKKEYIADFVCYEKIIVELKAINKISSIEESQILNYLKATNLKLGLIINFGNSKLEWKRYIF